jgi:hypothetical protein
MNTVDLRNVKAGIFVGVHINHQGSVDDLVDLKFELSKRLPFAVTLPCGSTYTLERIEDLPNYDVECPCGNPAHWFVKYSEIEKVVSNG